MYFICIDISLTHVVKGYTEGLKIQKKKLNMKQIF